MPPTGTPDLLSHGRQTRIMADYKFIIECKRNRRRRRRHRRKHPTRLAREYILKNSISRSYQSNEFVLRVCSRTWDM